MTKIRKKYDRTFKERAVELSKDRKNISELARELGVQPPNYINGVKNQKISDQAASLAMEISNRHQSRSV